MMNNMTGAGVVIGVGFLLYAFSFGWILAEKLF